MTQSAKRSWLKQYRVYLYLVWYWLLFGGTQPLFETFFHQKKLSVAIFTVYSLSLYTLYYRAFSTYPINHNVLLCALYWSVNYSCFWNVTTSNSWHYSCPRSVYCRSLVFLLVVSLFEIYRLIMKIFTHIPYNTVTVWDKNRKRKVPFIASVRFTQFWSKHSQLREQFILNHKK